MANVKRNSFIPINLTLILSFLISVSATFALTARQVSRNSQKNPQTARLATPEEKSRNPRPGKTDKSPSTPAGNNLLLGPAERILYGRTEGTGLGGEKSTIYGTQTLNNSTPYSILTIDDLEPSFSRDGSKIVFVSRRDNLEPGVLVRDEDREIYIMDSDGSNQVRLTNNGTPEGQPTFSPDGTKIVYIGSVPNGNFFTYGIYTMDLDGSNPTLIADENCGSPYNGNGNQKRGQNSDQFLELGGFDSPNYSADGSKVIFGLFSESVNRVNSHGTGCQVLYFLENASYPAQPVYSPDGTKIAVVESDFQYDPDLDDDVEFLYLRILDANGNQLEDIFPFRFISTPVWSPDGSRIAYISGELSTNESAEFFDGIWTVGVTLVESIQVNFYPGLGFFEGLTWNQPTAPPNLRLQIEQPHPVRGGLSTQGKVTIDPSLVPPEGTTINLTITGNTGVLSLPQSTVFVPSGLTEATFPIDTLVATTNQSAEVRAEISGNTAEHTVSVLKSRADLTITEVTAPTNVSAGIPFDVTYKVKNIGGLATDSSWLERIRFSTDSTLEVTDPQIGSRSNPGPLAPNAEVQVTEQVNIGGTDVPGDGDYYIFVRANPLETLPEDNYDNNFLSTQVHVDLPDLIAENIVVPANSEPGETYTITWDVKNQGAVDAPASTTRLYFSPDNTAGNIDDIILDTVPTNALTAGQLQSFSRPVAIPTTPATPTGTSFFYVRVDLNNDVTEGTPSGNGEGNNTTFSSTQFEYRVPDLQIASISPPPEIETDTVTPLSWNTNNAGNKPAGPFFDQVFFSLDEQVGSDIFLGSFQLATGLDAATSVNRIQDISIPTDSVPSNGDYYIYVKTDAAFAVNEGENEDNNITFQQVTIRKIDRPDLQVTNVTGPTTAFFDQVVQVQWTVTNSGAGPTNTPNWKDRVYIGTDPNSLVGASFLVNSSSVSYLNVGESYIATATVRIPRGLNGSYHFLVSTDFFDNVNEEVENNNLLSTPITLNVPLLPDYTVTQVQAPDTAFAGAPIQIDWEVKNQGDGSNQRNDQGQFPNQVDRVYLSQDTTLDVGTDRLLFTRIRAGELQSNATYSGNTFDGSPNVQDFVSLPNDIQGEWYAFVVTDATDQVYEFTSEINNSAYDQSAPGSPINILSTPPDLIVEGQPTAPVTANGGEFIDISYTAKNQGAFATDSTWFDAIYLSTDQTFDGGDTYLGNTGFRGGMAAGAQEVVDISVRIPNCENGTYYLFAVADFTNLQYEFDPNFDAEANNASLFRQIQVTSDPPDLQVSNFTVPAITQPGQTVGVSLTVTNAGGDAPLTGWNDRIDLISNTGLPLQQVGLVTRTGGLSSGSSYTVNTNITLPTFMEGEYFLRVTSDFNDLIEECGAENNNSADSAPFTVSNNLPDLQIDTVTIPGSSQVGGTINVQWTGRNAGQAMGQNPGWNDHIYISADPTYSIGDVSLGQELIQQVLPAGGTYQRQKQVTIPNVAAGTYYVLVFSDRNNNVTEGTTTSPFEQNNITASIPVTVTAPGIDLQVSNLTVSTPTYSGRSVTVNWDVTNAGASDTATGIWTDYVYLSRDGVIDNGDHVLGYLQHSAILGAGQTYQESRNYLIPNGLTGDYSIIVHTDRHNTVVESDNTNNFSPPFNVNLQLPPPADLNITNITVPATINLNNPTGISWTVMNSGPDSAIGTWRDSVYISRDQFWDASDFLLGQKERANTTLAIGSTYTESIPSSQLFVEEGDYYVIVRTDSRNSIREANEANNISTSISQTTVEITQLQIDTPLDTTLISGFRKVFRFDPPSNETLIVSLMGEPGKSNELFTKFDTIVSRADYDYQGTRPGEPDQENVIPESETGTYYSLVSNDFIPQSFADAFDKAPEEFKENGKKVTKRFGTPDQNITVTAEVIPFSVRKVTPTSAGNEGFASLIIEGAKFQDGATAKLIAADNSEILPVQAKNSVNKVAAIFDLRGQAPGIYSVAVINPDSSTEILNDGFEIVEGGGHALRPGIVGPSRLGPFPSTVRYTFTAVNDGLNDAIRVPIIFGMSGLFDYELDDGNLFDYPIEAYPAGTVPTSEPPIHFDIDGKRYVMLMAPILRSKSSIEINIDIVVPALVSIRLEAAVLPPISELLSDLRSSGGANLANVQFLGSSPSLEDCVTEFLRGFALTVAGIVAGVVIDDDCIAVAFDVGAFAADLISGFALGEMTGNRPSNSSVATSFGSFMFSFILDTAKCAGKKLPWVQAAQAAIAIGLLVKSLVDCLTDVYIVEVDRIISFDPNDKVGPEGYGPERFVGLNQPLLYRINFENIPEATAPAQRISVIDQLPPSLDPRTVRLKEIGFKQNRYIVPDNQAFFQERVQLGPDLNDLKADLTAGLDIVNGRIFWTLTAIDPETGDRPTDPLEGILPPNNANQDGEGYVTFTVEPMAGQATRTELNNLATIIFDENEPILTNTTSNLLDSGVPTSSVTALPATTGNPVINLGWSGSEDVNGSGLKGYNIYVSEDGDPYSLLFSNTLETSGTFTGDWGKNYRFYSIASDNAGNVELPPAMSDATISVLGGSVETDLSPRPNGDSNIDSGDTTQVRRFVAGLDTDFTFNEFQRADSAPLVDGGNGSLTIADVIQSRRFVDGLDPSTQAGGPNSLLPYSGSKSIAGKHVGPTQRQLRPVRVTRVADRLLLAIELDSQGDEVGLGFTINYDPAILSSPSDAVLGTDTAGANLTVNTSQANLGQVGVLIDKNPTQPFTAGTRQVFRIVFDIALGSPVSTVIDLTGSPVKNEVVDGLAIPLTTTFSSGTIQLLGPTSAGVSVAGRVTNASGRAIGNATVTITDTNGERRNQRANQFGYYRFTGVNAGQQYVLTVRAKGYQTGTRVLTTTDDVVGFDIVLQDPEDVKRSGFLPGHDVQKYDRTEVE